MENYAREMDKEKFYGEMLEASKDPLFIKDLEETMKDFQYVDGETTGDTLKP